MKKIRYHYEALLLKAFFAIVGILPLDMASALGGFFGRIIGPWLKANRIAIRNIAQFLPEYTYEEQQKILRNMWDNLGRVGAELSHLPKNDLLSRIEITGGENMPNSKGPAFFFSGHYGNWELLPIVSEACGVKVTVVYREANNSMVDKAVAELRKAHARNMFPKGRQGAVKMVRAIKNNEAIAMLIDQKMSDGIVVPFFGRIAMTAPAIAELALRYNMPIIPARVVRKKGAYFKAIIYPPLEYTKTGDEEKDTLAIMTMINTMLEGWIREHPEQWFWVHKRWEIKNR